MMFFRIIKLQICKVMFVEVTRILVGENWKKIKLSHLPTVLLKIDFGSFRRRFHIAKSCIPFFILEDNSILVLLVGENRNIKVTLFGPFI